MSMSKRWCYTLNNYSPEDELTMAALPSVYHVYGREVGESGTPHLQGFIVFASNKRFSGMKKLHADAHWEPARKSSETCSNYCKKGEQSKSEWEELHDDGPNFGLNASVVESGQLPNQKGKRTDLDAVKEAIEGGMTSLRDLRKHHSGACSRHMKFIQEYIADNRPPPGVKGKPKPWQLELEAKLASDADDRTVIFVVDGEGSAGKSWFVRYYLSKHMNDTLFLSPGKVDDMKYSIANCGFDPRVILVDAPRGRSFALQQAALEECKNGMFWSYKYTPVFVNIPHPHIVVFTNEAVDKTMTENRYDVMEITPGTVEEDEFNDPTNNDYTRSFKKRRKN